MVNENFAIFALLLIYLYYMKYYDYSKVRFGQKLLLLLTTFMFCLIMTSIIASFVASLNGSFTTITTINLTIQNLVVFALPVFITGVFITPDIFKYLRLKKAPTIRALLFIIVAYVLMTPAFNYIVELNKNMSLPSSLYGLEQTLRNLEQNAQAVTDNLLNNMNIVTCILLISVLTGFCEELFFRGMMQKIFSEKMSKHIAIWTAALVFSVLHFQFFGFVPRLLLGAFFGYLVGWSGSLWCSIIAHAINNASVIINNYLINNNITNISVDTIGLPESGTFPVVPLISLVVTILFIKYGLRLIKDGKMEK